MNYEEKDSKLHVAKEPDFSYDKHYTYADYLNFTFDEMVEIIRGKIFRMSPAPTSLHQIISKNICWVIESYLRGKKCKMFDAPYDVILPIKDKDFNESDKVVQPDIIVVCDPSKIRDRGCFGAPDLVIEILSPSTQKKDLKLKYSIYEESGVKEYWIVDPINKSVEVFILENDKFRRVDAYVDDELVPCNTLPGLSIDLKEVFE